jgi:hypothetical protein
LARNLRQLIRRVLGAAPGTRSLSPAADRQALIERKAAVQAEIAQARSELARSGSGPGSRSQVEARLQALMAEEHRLRLLIDRTGRAEL